MPFMVPRACQVASEIEFRTNRIDPSQKATFTPPVCRLRAALYWEPAVVTGISGSLFGIAQLTTSGEVEFGVVNGIIGNLGLAEVLGFCFPAC